MLSRETKKSIVFVGANRLLSIEEHKQRWLVVGKYDVYLVHRNWALGSGILKNGGNNVRRIERLKDGRLYISASVAFSANYMPDTDFYAESIDDERIKEPLKTNYLVLLASDIDVTIENVGRRVSDTVFWVEE